MQEASSAAKKKLHDQRDPFADMDPEERAKLHAAIEQSEEEIAAGEGIAIEEVIAELHSS